MTSASISSHAEQSPPAVMGWLDRMVGRSVPWWKIPLLAQVNVDKNDVEKIGWNKARLVHGCNGLETVIIPVHPLQPVTVLQQRIRKDIAYYWPGETKPWEASNVEADAREGAR